MQIILYFASILLTCALSGFLAFYAWRQRSVPGSRAYAGLALGECLLALAEILSMLSPTLAQALFWFKVRYLSLAAIPVLWLVFALEYSGRKDWLSKRLLAGLFVIPVVTQVLLWSNNLHGLWAKQEVGFHQNGAFWMAQTSARLPGLGFLAHSFYGMLLLLAGIVLLLVAAWRMRRLHRGQALLVAGAASTAFVFALVVTFNLMPRTEFNPFTPGIGLSVLLIALAVFRSQFLKRAPAAETDSKTRALEAQAGRSLAVVLLIFVLMAAGITATAFVSYQDYEQHFRHQVESQLSSIAALKGDELQDWRKERLADAEILYRNPSFSALVQRYLENPADARAQAELQAWLDRYQAYGQYDRVFLLDARGVERLSALAPPEPVAAHLAQEVAAVLSAGQVTFVDFHRDTDDGPIRLAVLVPIYAEQDNRPLGILVLRIDPSVYLYPYLQLWPVPSASAETLLVRRDGADALYLNELKFQAGTALNLRIPLENTQVLAAKAVLGQAGIVEGVDYRGVPALGVVHAVPASPWFLVARMDTAEVYAPLRERLWETVVFFGALMTAAGAGLGLVWRQQRASYYRGQIEAAQALRESEERYQLANRATFNAIWDWNLQTNAVWWNDNFQALFGYRSEEIEPGIEARTRRIHPKDLARVERGIHAAIDSGQQSWGDQYRFRCKDGRYVEIEDRGYISRDSSGKPVRMIGAMQDVTERKRAEEALRESEERYRTLFENAQMGMYRSKLDGSAMLAINKKLAEIFGYSIEEMLAEPAAIRWANPEDRDAMVRQLREKGILLDYEVPILTKSGEIKTCLASIKLYPQEGYLEGSVIDITERKRAEEALRESEDKFKYVFDYTTVGKSITFPSGELSVNKAFCEMLGYTQEELQNQRWQDITHPDDIELTQRAIDPLLSGEKESLRLIKRYIHKSGAVVWVDVSTSLRRDKEGKPLYFMTAVSDITERKRQEAQILAAQTELRRLLAEADQSRRTLLSVVEDQKTAEEKIRQLNAELELRVRDRTAQLEAANQELEAFAYSVSHDLRAPLRGIDGWSLALQEDYGDRLDGQARQYLDRVRAEAQRMGQLIDDLLQLSRVTRAEMQPRPVDLTALAHTVAARLREAQPERQVELVIQPGLTAHGDARLLEVALTNLLGNGWKFTGARPQACIEFGCLPHPSLPSPPGRGAGGEGPTFFVRDNGVGFDMAYAQKLFGAFQRMHKASEFPGTGIGLATVQRIVHRHGGRVWAEAHVDQGATFYFTLEEAV